MVYNHDFIDFLFHKPGGLLIHLWRVFIYTCSYLISMFIFSISLLISVIHCIYFNSRILTWLLYIIDRVLLVDTRFGFPVKSCLSIYMLVVAIHLSTSILFLIVLGSLSLHSIRCDHVFFLVLQEHLLNCGGL